METKYRKALDRVHPMDKDLVSSFCELKANRRVGYRRLIKVVRMFRMWRDIYLPAVPWDSLTKDQVNAAVRKLDNDPQYAEWTRSDLKKHLKQVFRYVRDTKEPPEIADVQARKKPELMPPEPPRHEGGATEREGRI